MEDGDSQEIADLPAPAEDESLIVSPDTTANNDESGEHQKGKGGTKHKAVQESLAEVAT
ncbi:MAG: hypothetical protein ACRBHB_14950 [Arenicella sp.]